MANFQAHRVGIIDILSRHLAIRILSNDMTIMWHELLECRPDVAPPENVLAFNIGLCSLKREKAILFDLGVQRQVRMLRPHRRITVEALWDRGKTRTKKVTELNRELKEQQITSKTLRN
jgi:hypothetical protein